MMLSNKNIIEFLISHGFDETHAASGYIEFEHPVLKTVYVNTRLAEQSLKPYPLIIDLKWLSKEPLLFQRKGVFRDGGRRSASLRNLSKNKVREGKPAKTGLAIGFSSIKALGGFLDDIKEVMDDQSAVASFRSLGSTLRKSITLSEDKQALDAILGQGECKASLNERWKGSSVTGYSNTQLLAATQIKPAPYCSKDELTDPNNGLLLEPGLAHAMRAGLISFSGTGEMIISPRLTDQDARHLGITVANKLQNINGDHMPYVKWHREHLLREFL